MPASAQHEKITALAASMEVWFRQREHDIDLAHQTMLEKIRAIRSRLQIPVSSAGPVTGLSVGVSSGGASALPAELSVAGLSAAAPRTPRRGGGFGGAYAAVMDEMDSDWSAVAQGVMATPPPQSRQDATPMGSPQSADKLPLEVLLSRIAQAGNSPPMNLEALYERSAPTGSTLASDGDEGAAPAVSNRIPMTSLLSMHGQSQTTGIQLEEVGDTVRPRVVAIANGESDDPARHAIDLGSTCQVLVEFKRKRVLQFESSRYVAPGQYVVVGGDRGEDIGLVIYAWCETTKGSVKGIGLRNASLTRSIGVGSGVVVRQAQPAEISQLHTTISELERRAVDVCQHRVLEFGLPMVIVDAEYQFDRKKLTFFYEAQQRLDFRDLVRDLFKTFRARIWMEPLE